MTRARRRRIDYYLQQDPASLRLALYDRPPSSQQGRI